MTLPMTPVAQAVSFPQCAVQEWLGQFSQRIRHIS